MFDKNKFPILGAALGLLLALLLINFGFYKTILIFILVVLGTFAGFYLQASNLLEEIKRRINK